MSSGVNQEGMCQCMRINDAKTKSERYGKKLNPYLYKALESDASDD